MGGWSILTILLLHAPIHIAHVFHSDRDNSELETVQLSTFLNSECWISVSKKGPLVC